MWLHFVQRSLALFVHVNTFNCTRLSLFEPFHSMATNAIDEDGKVYLLGLFGFI